MLGKEFRPGAIICLQSPSNTDFPIFGEITRIFVPNDTKKLLVQLYDTENYSPHYNGYQVAKIDQFRVVSLDQLEVYHKYCHLTYMLSSSPFTTSS